MKVSSVIQIILFRSIAISGQPSAIAISGRQTSEWCELVDGVAVIPDGTDKIPNYAFAYCPGPFSIMIPASVMNIGLAAFAYSGLSSISFDDDSLLEEIGDSAFWGCITLESIPLPASVTSIGANAFEESGLSSISFDDDSLLEKIGRDAFWGCKALESIPLPASVTSIGDRAFEESGLTSIDFEAKSSLEEIGDSAFNGCKFRRIALPKSVIKIGVNAFKDCTELTKFRIRAGVVTIGDGAFKGCTKLKRLSIPTKYLATRLL